MHLGTSTTDARTARGFTARRAWARQAAQVLERTGGHGDSAITAPESTRRNTQPLDEQMLGVIQRKTGISGEC